MIPGNPTALWKSLGHPSPSRSESLHCSDSKRRPVIHLPFRDARISLLSISLLSTGFCASETPYLPPGTPALCAPTQDRAVPQTLWLKTWLLHPPPHLTETRPSPGQPLDTPRPRGVSTIIIPGLSLPSVKILKVTSHKGYQSSGFQKGFQSNLFLLINLTQKYI